MPRLGRGYGLSEATGNLLNAFLHAQKRKREEELLDEERAEKQKDMEFRTSQFEASTGIPLPTFQRGSRAFEREITGQRPVGPLTEAGEFETGEKAALGLFKKMLASKIKSGSKLAELLDDVELGESKPGKPIYVEPGKPNFFEKFKAKARGYFGGKKSSEKKDPIGLR